VRGVSEKIHSVEEVWIFSETKTLEILWISDTLIEIKIKTTFLTVNSSLQTKLILSDYTMSSRFLSYDS